MTFKLNWSYLKWYFPAIHNKYPEYTIDAAEVLLQGHHFYFVIPPWKAFYLGFT